jgi:hypothetical protein
LPGRCSSTWTTPLILFVLVILFCQYWVWTQGFALEEALYCLGHTTNPELVIFEIESLFMPRLAWTSFLLFVLPHVAGMTSVPPLCPAIGWNVGSQTFCWC